MAEYFVGPVMEKLIHACLKYLKDQVGWKTDVEEELKKLRFILPQIQAVVSAYSQVETIDPSLNEWYWQLRDAIDEADDVLDEFEYWNLEKKKQVIGENKGKRKAEVPVWNIYENVKRALRIGKRAPKSDPNLTKLELAVHKLHEISAQVSTFHSLVKVVEEKQQMQLRELHEKRETGALITDVLLGRRKEMEYVSRWLIKNSYERQTTNYTTDLYRNISLLSIVGHGGMGKTTLLQHVYKDATTLFDVRMWACVSTNFDVKTLIKNISESLQNKQHDQESLVSLQNGLQSKVTSKRFLLVLDDIWEEDDAKWENVLAPLQYGSSGSKIVITTRLDSVATKFANLIKKRKKILALKGLKEKKCLKLFNSHAFAGVENPDDEFKSIAGKMVKKLFGSPLAAKVIGGILNSYIDKSYWKKVLNTNIGKVGHDQNQLLSILKLSYIYLPKFLQNCFSFCCIFPQDYEFDKNDLVRMWIALGFIESSNIQEETLEDTGRRYFNILIQKSFFDEFCDDYGRIYYKMHDLLHELAQFVAGHECLTIVGDKAFSIPPTTRHLSISSIKHAIKNMGELKNLRSLFMSCSFCAGEFNENVICEILKASKSIRLLAIKFEGIKHFYKLYEEIGCLIHLRYLKVERLWHFELPRSISHLYHLQFVIAEELPCLQSDWIELMPNENCQIILNYLAINDPSATKLTMEPLRRISSFRQLKIESNDELVSFPTETMQWFLRHSSSLFSLKFDNLQSLQSLPSSLECLSSLNYLYVENVPQLKLLPNPPASLVTLNLVRLKSLQCLPSSLPNISSLKCIYLYGLENLDRLPSSLPTRLRELYIIEVPRLLELPDLPSSIEKLELEKLKSFKCLPSSLPTFSSLTFLKLINIPLLELLPDLPSSLKHLEFEDLESLQCLPSSLSTITSLTSLRFKNILPFKSLSDLPSSLITLNLEDLKSLQCHQPYSLLTFSSLTYLTLKNIPLLKSLPDLPSSLKDLRLADLELQCLPSSLSTISSVTHLSLTKIPLLKSLQNLPSSLITLNLKDLESLECLPSSLSTISSLQYLILKNISLLKSLPDLLSSLKYLRLEDLESLECLPSSLSTISSLENLHLINIPHLKSLPDLPSSLRFLWINKVSGLLELTDLLSSLKVLYLGDLESLQSLPSSLSAISSLESLYLINLPHLNSLPDLPSSLTTLWIHEVPGLLELPDFPASLNILDIKDCQPQLMERYPNFNRER